MEECLCWVNTSLIQFLGTCQLVKPTTGVSRFNLLLPLHLPDCAELAGGQASLWGRASFQPNIYMSLADTLNPQTKSYRIGFHSTALTRDARKNKTVQKQAGTNRTCVKRLVRTTTATQNERKLKYRVVKTKIKIYLERIFVLISKKKSLKYFTVYKWSC